MYMQDPLKQHPAHELNAIITVHCIFASHSGIADLAMYAFMWCSFLKLRTYVVHKNRNLWNL